MKSAALLMSVCLITGCGTEQDQLGRGQAATPGHPSEGPLERGEPRLMDASAVGFFGQLQQANNWCWAACLRLVINGLIYPNMTTPPDSLDEVLTQEAIVSQMFGGSLLDDTATAPSMVQLINGRVFQHKFKHGSGVINYTISAQYVPRMLTPGELRRLAGGNHSVILLIPGHAVVLIGRSFIQDGWDVFDPWPRRGLRVIQDTSVSDLGSADRIMGCVVLSLSEG